VGGFYTGVVKFLIVFSILMSENSRATSLRFITLEVAPWAYREKPGSHYVGIFPEIVEELEQRAGHDIKITLTPYARINRELEMGRQDCTMLIKEPERDKTIILGELIFNHPMGVIASKNISLTQYNDLYGIRISVLRSLFITDQFNNDNKLSKEFDTDYVIGLRKIQHGRVDAIAGAIPTIQYLVNNNDMGDFLGEPLELSSEPIYLQCSRQSKKLQYIDDINNAIRAIKQDGTLERILKKHS